MLYMYNSNTEWINNIDKLKNVNYLKYLNNSKLILNKPLNNNRKNIDDILISNDNITILEQLFDLKKNILYLSKKIDIDKINDNIFRNYIINQSFPDKLQYSFGLGKMTDSNIKSANIIANLGEANKRLVKKNENEIKASLNSLFGWRNVDLKLHAIGSAYNIAELITLSISQSMSEVPEDMVNIFKSYGIKSQSFPKFKAYKNRRMFDPVSDSFTKKEIDHINISNSIKDAIVAVRDNNNNISKEFLVVLLYTLLFHSYTELILRIEQTVSNNIDKSKPNNIFIFKNLKTSIERYKYFIDNLIKQYFGLNELISNGTTDKIAKQTQDGICRVIGGIENINTQHFTFEDYPIALKFGKIDILETKSRLTKLLLSNVYDDNGELMYMGGSVLDINIGTISVRLLSNNLKLHKSKQLNKVKIVDNIIKKMKNKIHIKNIISFKKELQSLYLKLLDKTNKTKNVQFNAISAIIGEKYSKLKKMQVKYTNYIKKISEINNVSGNKQVELAELREHYIVILNQVQILSKVYKIMALELYKDLQSRNTTNKLLISVEPENDKLTLFENRLELNKNTSKFPEKYYDQLIAVFNDIDNNIDQNVSINNSFIINKLGDNWRNVLINKNKNMTNFLNKNNLIKNTNISKNINKPKLDVVSETFWLDLRNILDGKTIYIPYVNQRSMLNNTYGLFDMMEACIRGYISNIVLISESKLGMRTLTEKIEPRGYILVGNTVDDKIKPSNWKCILKKEIQLLSKLSTDDIRQHFYDLLINSTLYNKRASVMWSNDSKLKEKVLRYCRITTGYNECKLITSRSYIYSLIKKIKN